MSAAEHRRPARASEESGRGIWSRGSDHRPEREAPVRLASPRGEPGFIARAEAPEHVKAALISRSAVGRASVLPGSVGDVVQEGVDRLSGLAGNDHGTSPVVRAHGRHRWERTPETTHELRLGLRQRADPACALLDQRPQHRQQQCWIFRTPRSPTGRTGPPPSPSASCGWCAPWATYPCRGTAWAARGRCLTPACPGGKAGERRPGRWAGSWVSIFRSWYIFFRPERLYVRVPVVDASEVDRTPDALGVKKVH